MLHLIVVTPFGFLFLFYLGFHLLLPVHFPFLLSHLWIHNSLDLSFLEFLLLLGKDIDSVFRVKEIASACHPIVCEILGGGMGMCI